MRVQPTHQKLITARTGDGACLAYVTLATGQWIITKNGQELAKGDNTSVDRAQLLLQYLSFSAKQLAN